MPKSKRNQVVHLTQVKKKGKDHKEDLIKQLEQYVAKFKRVFVFDFDQAKSDRIMNLRVKLKDIGRIFSGKNSLVSLTLKTVGSRTNTDYENLVKQVSGHRGLLFTDIECKKLLELLDREQPEFCKKLLGYADIAPETQLMEVDSGDDKDDDDDEVSPDEVETKKTKKKKIKDKKSEKKQSVKPKRKRKRKSAERREVKFVKL